MQLQVEKGAAALAANTRWHVKLVARILLTLLFLAMAAWAAEGSYHHKCCAGLEILAHNIFWSSATGSLACV